MVTGVGRERGGMPLPRAPRNARAMGELPVSVGERVILRLDSLAVGGEAVGRYEGLAVFAVWGCPGDEAEVEITEVGRSFARGVVRSIISPSPDRVEAPCPHFGDCGGCQLQHISYDAQLRHKAAMVRESVARIAGLSDAEVGETWGMEDPWRYRNRAEYHVRRQASGKIAVGFTRHRSHEVVALRECRLQHALSERVRAAVEELLPHVAQGAAERAALLGVETLVSFSSGQIIATLVCDGEEPSFLSSLAEALAMRLPELTGLLAALRRGRGSPRRSPSTVLWGDSHVIEEIAGRTYRVSADSFFQTNPAQAARAVELVEEWAAVQPGDTVLDLYCGVGTFLLPLAGSAKAGRGVESDRAAYRDARANARRWRLPNVKLYERNVERLVPRWVERGRRADVVVLDPPRKGCGPIVCATAARLNPRRIILVSCDPATFARDLASLAEEGYKVRHIQPIDMFPQTWHVEAVAVCERRGGV